MVDLGAEVRRGSYPQLASCHCWEGGLLEVGLLEGETLVGVGWANLAVAKRAEGSEAEGGWAVEGRNKAEVGWSLMYTQ